MSLLPPEIESEKNEILKDAEALLKNPSRRRMLGNVLTLGGLVALTGVTVTHKGGIDDLLKSVSRFNDGAQGFLFDPKKLAPTYREADITRPFPFNAYYGRGDLESKVKPIDDQAFRLKLSGQIGDKRNLSLPDLRAMPQIEQITRHICVEGWSAIGRWGGVRFAEVLNRIHADLTAKYVGFKCSDGYYTSIDMPTALHPQTLLTLTYDGQVLPLDYGYPMKLRMPTKLGYKNPKYIEEIFVTNIYPGGFWEDQGYNWFGGS